VRVETSKLKSIATFTFVVHITHSALEGDGNMYIVSFFRDVILRVKGRADESEEDRNYHQYAVPHLRQLSSSSWHTV